MTGKSVKMTKSPLLILAALCTPFLASPARAQAVSAADRQLVQAVLAACPADWSAQPCLKAVSGANLVMAANYGSSLQQSGQAAAAESVKNHCAASTAATQGNFPAYAFRSAFTECANTLTDLAQQTGKAPDPVLFPVLVDATLCLSGDQRCAAMTQQLQGYAR